MWGDGCFRFLESLLFAFTSASSRFKLPILSYELFLPLHYTITDQTKQRADSGVLRCQGKKAENIPKEEVLIGLLFYSSDHREVVAMWPIAKNLCSGSAINNYRTVGRI